MLTIFSIPKPFSGHVGVIQHNAIRSWSRLRPACQVVLFGVEKGVEVAVAAFGTQHIPHVVRNEYVTPLLNSVFEQVRQIAEYPLMCYINTDVMLLSDFLKAVERIRFKRFLMVGQRWDVEISESWDVKRPDCESELRRFVREHGILHPPMGSDFFVFPVGAMWELPPFAVGRPGWDNWMIYRARAMKFPVVDASRVTTVIHQKHDYDHVTKVDSRAAWEGPEADLNRELVGGWEYVFTLADATHLLTRRLLTPAFGPAHFRRRWQTLPILRPRMRPIVQAVSWGSKSAVCSCQFVTSMLRRDSTCKRASKHQRKQNLG